MKNSDKTKEELISALDSAYHDYRSIISASPDVITITDLEGKIIFSSPRAVEMFGGANPEIFIGHNLLEFIDPADHERAIAGIKSMFGGNYLGADEYKGVRMIYITRDISERKAAERKLAKSEASFKNLIENLNDVIYENLQERSPHYCSYRLCHER